MKYILIFFSIIIILAVIFIVSAPSISLTGFVTAKNEESNMGEDEIPSFRLYTKAICQNISNFIVCHDELFASCGELEYMLPKGWANGTAIFGKNWNDPRD